MPGCVTADDGKIIIPRRGPRDGWILGEGSVMHPYSRVLEELIEIVSIDLYFANGILEGNRILVTGLREGTLNAYMLDNSKLVKLNKEPITGVAEARYGATRVIVSRDIAKGREQELLYTISIDKPGDEKPLEGMKPIRVLGVVDAGDRVVYSGSTMKENAVYIYEPGKGVRKAVSLPGIGMLTDTRGSLAVGVGAFKPTGKFQLFLVDLETGELRIEEHEEGSVSQARIAPEGTIVYSLERASDAVLLALDPDGMKKASLELAGKDLEDMKPIAFNYIGFTPQGELIATARRNGRSRLFVDGYYVETPEGMLGSAYKLGEKIIVSHTSLKQPPRIIAVGAGGYNVVLEGRKPKWMEEALDSMEFRWIESFDGEKVPTFILKSGRASTPGPAIMLVHGGPFAEDSDSWSIFSAALAALGLHVIKPNYRGSTGYGESWRLKIVGDPCGGELEDITSVAKWALETGLASRLYIMGYSYGGYMTLCSLVKKPGLYKAGIAGASVVDWEEMYELSDAAFKQFIEIMFAGKKELWRERSPINYVDNLREPLLLIHPQNDSRTPLKPLLRFMEKALEKGKSFEAYIAPDMGHVVNNVEDIVKILLPAVLFIARQEGLGGQSRS